MLHAFPKLAVPPLMVQCALYFHFTLHNCVKNQDCRYWGAMAPARRRPRQKTAQNVSRVHKITSMEQWKAMLQKAGDARLVFVQFYQSAAWTCKQMRPYFTRMSTQPKFRKAIFAEVEVDEVEVSKLAVINHIQCAMCAWLKPTEPFARRMSPSPPVSSGSLCTSATFSKNSSM